MPADASAQLRAIALELKSHADGRVLKNRMLRNMRAAAEPLKGDVRAAARRQLPHRGGLAERVAGERITVSIVTGLNTAGVRLKTSAPSTAQTDKGFVRHPTFGRRGKGEWTTQQIPAAAGWWSSTLARRSYTVTPAIVAAMQRTAAEIERG